MTNLPRRLGRRPLRTTFFVLLATFVPAVGQFGCDVPRGVEMEPRGDHLDKHAMDGERPKTPVNPLSSGVEFLLAAQDDDGAWRSQTYGSLKGGAATTALVLYALSHLDEPRGELVDAAASRALGFLQPGIEKFGYVCDPDGTPAYPTYGAAMLLVAADRLRLSLPPAMRETLVDDLVRDQLTERQGWQPDDLHYGGWDVVRAERASPPRTSGTNISVSAFALEAIHVCQHKEKADVLARARRWVERCQNFPQDGGFFFSPDVTDAMNKAGSADAEKSQPRSYGTATCDGLRSLIYCGVAVDNPRVRAAVAWLASHQSVDEVPGFEPSDLANRWSAGLVYYHCATLAKVLVYLPADERASRGERIRKFLTERQQPDRHWANDVSRMREDDPLIATAFAVIALAEIAAK